MEAKKRQREQLANLMTTLDSLIPARLRRVAQKNGAGRRAVGVGGRSLHDVLQDAVHCVGSITAAGTPATTPGAEWTESPSRRDAQEDCHTARAPRTSLREALLSSESLLCVEVDLHYRGPHQHKCTVVELGRGAQAFIGDVPWGKDTLLGFDLVDIIHPADAHLFLQLVAGARCSRHARPGRSDKQTGAKVGAEHEAVSVRMLQFLRYRFPRGRRPPVDESAASNSSAGDAVAEAETGGKRWNAKDTADESADGKAFDGEAALFPQAFDHDPLLEDSAAPPPSRTAAGAGETQSRAPLSRPVHVARHSPLTVCQYKRVRVQLAVGGRDEARAQGGRARKRLARKDGEQGGGAEATVRAVLLLVEEDEGDSEKGDDEMGGGDDPCSSDDCAGMSGGGSCMCMCVCVCVCVCVLARLMGPAIVCVCTCICVFVCECIFV